jgi:hypothetical protein
MHLDGNLPARIVTTGVKLVDEANVIVFWRIGNVWDNMTMKTAICAAKENVA